jgi:D-alanine-D-alanine ligase
MANIIVLHGCIKEDAGKDEEDTIVQAEAITSTLTNLGHRAEILTTDLNLHNLRNVLIQKKTDIVFYLVEAIDGVGKYIHLPATVLEELKIPFTGNSSEAIIVTTSKILTKKLLTSQNLPTPKWCSVEDGLASPAKVPLPCIIKHMHEHASFGMDESSVAFTYEKLLAKINTIPICDHPDYFLEEFIDGREFNISVLGTKNGPHVLPCAEILFEGYGSAKIKIVDFKAKWDENSFEYGSTPRTFDFAETDKELLKKLQQISIDAWKYFGLIGYARVDFRIDIHGNPYILEINTNPCISPDAGFVAAASRAGYSYEQLIETLLTGTLKK